MHVLCIVAAFAIFTREVNAQESDTRAELLRKRRQSHADLFRVVDLAQAVPPQFSADTLLKVAVTPGNQDREWRIELLELAFELGAQASEPNRQRIPGWRIAAKGRAEIRSAGFDQRLDKLSLQCRAVREMMKLDKKSALEMFQRISWPKPRRLDCRDALIDNFDEYYNLLGEIEASGFTAEQRRSGHHVDLLSRQINRISSSVEVGTMAKALSSSTLTDDELGLVAGRLSVALEQIQPDDRSFSSAYGANDQELQNLARVLRARGVSTGGIVAAYRRYLVRSLNSARCADGGGNELSSEVVNTFNRALASDSDSNLAPLTQDEVKPTGTQGHADMELFVDDAEFDQVWQEFLDLVLGKGHGPLLGKGTKPLTDEEKSTIEWRTQFDSFLGRIDELKPRVGESEHQTFHRKATALNAALRAARRGSDQEKVIRRYVALLKSSNLQQESPLEWYAELKRGANSIQGFGPEARTIFLGELENSGVAVLGLYAVATRVLPDAN